MTAALITVAAVCAISAAVSIIVAVRQKVRAREAEKREKEFLSKTARNEKFYTDLVQGVEQVKRLHHDLKHHLVVISGLCDNGDVVKIQEYVQSLGSSLPKRTVPAYCGIYEVNILIHHFSCLCEESNIMFVADLRIGKHCKMNPTELCVVIGNGLQNAVDACLRSEMRHPFVSVVGVQTKGKLAVRIENSFDGQVNYMPDGSLKSRKGERGHGLGLSGVRSVAERYRGWVHTSWSETVFVLETVLITTDDFVEKSDDFAEAAATDNFDDTLRRSK